METKPGIRTTEFWITAITSFLQVLNLAGAWNFVPNKYSVLILGGVNAAYAVARGIAKVGVPAALPTDTLGAAIASRLVATATPSPVTEPPAQPPV